MSDTAVIAGIRGTAGQRPEAKKKEVLPNVKGNCSSCDSLIKAIPNWASEIGYYWPKTCHSCGKVLVLPNR